MFSAYPGRNNFVIGTQMALSPLLVDAKREYTHQLADVLAPYVFDTVAMLYERSKRQQPAFREYLRRVPHWNASMITEKTNEIERKNPQLQDLIAACCVSYTKVLGSIRLSNSQNSNFRIALPESGVFVHGVYIHVAKEFYYVPDLVTANRFAKMDLVRAAVEESIRQHVPIKDLLKAYLSVAVDTGGLDPMAIPESEEYEDSSPMEQQQQQQMMMQQPAPQPVMAVMQPVQQFQPVFQPQQPAFQPAFQPQQVQQPAFQMQQQQPQQVFQQQQQEEQPQQQEFESQEIQVQYVPRDAAAAAGTAAVPENDIADFE